MSGEKYRILMTQEEIATCSGVSQQMISYVLRGDRRPSVEVAEKLEKCTGICRESWIFPERHFNPYQPIAEAQSCFACHNRVTRMEKIGETGMRIFRESEDKRVALKLIVRLGHVYNAYPITILMSVALIQPEGFEVIAQHGELNGAPLPDFIVKEAVPKLHEYASKGMKETVLCWPQDLPDYVTEEEKQIGYQFGLISAVYISAGKIFWMLLSSTVNFYWSEAMTDKLYHYTKELDKEWRKIDYA